MKVEIELSEVEALRERCRHEHENVERLEKQLSELNEEELKKRAVNLSYRLFEKYVKTVFKSLGFEPDRMNSSIFSSDLVYQLGKDWWTREKDITVTLGATVTENFRTAFINIGVVPKEQISEPDELKL